MRLDALVRRAAAVSPHAIAVTDRNGSVTYAELDRCANRVARTLLDLGVRRGDRVALWSEKSWEAVACMQAILRIGAAYVPLDPLCPAARAALILSGCAVSALIADTSAARAVAELGVVVPTLLQARSQGDERIDAVSWEQVAERSCDPLPQLEGSPDELAYILYTSGSTGVPKGVCISHRNALAFVDWAAELLGVQPADCLSNHAPFHFDLSVLDLYAAFHAGARVVLIDGTAAYSPRHLVDLLVRESISIWYSVPSALVLMMDRGELLQRATPGSHPGLSLRAILFAGESFPIDALRRLRDAFPHARLLNLYGPTETNVCTYHEVGAIAADRVAPVPIGQACCGDRAWAVRAGDQIAGPGEQGELLVEGPTVMLGYWGQPAQRGPYRTGDQVRVLADGSFQFMGRADHLVKVRGHRIEIEEIEATLRTADGVKEAAVVVIGEGLRAELIACTASDPARPVSLVRLKRICAERLPRHMIVHRHIALSEIPRTPNGKADRRALRELALRQFTAAPSADPMRGGDRA